MSVFSQIEIDRSAPWVVPLPASAWCSEYDARPRKTVQVGLRLLADGDLQTARAEAVRFARRMLLDESGQIGDMDAFIDAFNDGLLRWAIGRAACQPKDVDISFFESEEETVRRALTSEGVRFLWFELQKLHVAQSPLSAIATDQDLMRLAALLSMPGRLPTLSPAATLRVRKWLKDILEEFDAIT